MSDTRTAEIKIEDLPYRGAGERALLARIYRPAGAGPFPAAIDIHGGAWTSGDRAQNESIATALARNGIAVVAIDFRMPPEGRYPDSLADINFAIRWLKSRAGQFNIRREWIGGFGTSSGGHQILLAAMRPADPRYAALPLPEAPDSDARLAYVVSGWGVLEPLLRYRLAKERGNLHFVESHDSFWGSETAMSDGSPPLILDRGEAVDLPPALIFQGTADEWVPEALTRRFAESYRRAGGEMELVLLDGANHSFYREEPSGANARKAIAAVIDFIHRQTSQRRELRLA
jgi:acetyl esterase